MLNGRVACTLIILQGVFFHNKAQCQKPVSIQPTKKTSRYDRFGLTNSNLDLECKNKYVTTHPSDGELAKPRFIDISANTSASSLEMEAPALKHSLINLSEEVENDELSSKDEDYKEVDFGKNESEEKEEQEEEEDNNEDDDEDDDDDDDDDDDGINFFGDILGSSSDKPEDNKDNDDDDDDEEDAALKQYHRPKLRMHDFVFPLLIAYKLKFFTVIPLLLGALVLLVGTTGVAGFFFALFAAALGIHAKYHGPH